MDLSSLDWPPEDDDDPDVLVGVKTPEQQPDNLKANFENENSIRVDLKVENLVLKEEFQMEVVELDVVTSMSHDIDAEFNARDELHKRKRQDARRPSNESETTSPANKKFMFKESKLVTLPCNTDDRPQDSFGQAYIDKINEMYRQAREARWSCQYNEAVTLFSTIITLEGRNRNDRKFLAELWEQLGNIFFFYQCRFDLAITCYDSSARCSPNTLCISYRRAEAYYKRGNKDKAISECEHILERCPEHYQTKKFLTMLRPSSYQNQLLSFGPQSSRISDSFYGDRSQSRYFQPNHQQQRYSHESQSGYHRPSWPRGSQSGYQQSYLHGSQSNYRQSWPHNSQSNHQQRRYSHEFQPGYQQSDSHGFQPSYQQKSSSRESPSDYQRQYSYGQNNRSWSFGQDRPRPQWNDTGPNSERQDSNQEIGYGQVGESDDEHLIAYAPDDNQFSKYDNYY